MQQAVVSEYKNEYHERVAKQIPIKERLRYEEKAGIGSESEPELDGYLVFEDGVKVMNECQKYHEDVMAYGKQKSDEDFQRWRRKTEAEIS